MSKIGYGIIGCGGHAFQSHAIPGKNIPELELRGIFDINPGHLEHFWSEFGGRPEIYEKIESLLARPDIEAVLIASPDKFHIEQLRLALEAGKHVMVEKPLALHQGDLEDLKALLDLAEKKKLVVTTCHPRRFDPPFVWLKANMPKFFQTFGLAVGFHFDFSYHKPQARWKSGRSLLLDHLNHEVDLMHYLLGGMPFVAYKGCDSFDHYQVSGMRQDGIAFSFHGTRRLEGKLYLEWLTIRFETGSLVLDTHEGVAEIRNHETGLVERTNFCGKTNYPVRNTGIMRNFADTILGLAPNYLTREDLWVNNWLGVELLAHKTARYDIEPSKIVL